MKIARFEIINDNKVYYGEVQNDRIKVLEGDVFGSYRVTEREFALNQVRLLPPVVPGKVICIGMNYMDHIKELHGDMHIPEEPVIFMVSPTAVIGPAEAIELAYPDNVIDYEAELTVVIGKEGRNIPVDKAADYILGYTCGNDISDRTLQRKDGQFTRAKSFHTYKPLGPYIVTDLDPDNLRVMSRVNGQVRQNGSTRDLIKNAYNLVNYISGIMTLKPGDVILTGTPAGVGRLKPGDICEVEVEGIGILRNPVR